MDLKQQLVAALQAVEWVCGEWSWTCPWCGHSQSMGHAEDCQRQAALKAVEANSATEEGYCEFCGDGPTCAVCGRGKDKPAGSEGA